jgi:hypothetical protein
VDIFHILIFPSFDELASRIEEVGEKFKETRLVIALVWPPLILFFNIKTTF